MILDIVHHAVETARELLARQVFDRRDAQRQIFCRCDDGLRIQDERDTRLAAIGAPHRETSFCIALEIVLRDTGEIRMRREFPLVAVEVGENGTNHILAPAELLRDALHLRLPPRRTLHS